MHVLSLQYNNYRSIFTPPVTAVYNETLRDIKFVNTCTVSAIALITSNAAAHVGSISVGT